MRNRTAAPSCTCGNAGKCGYCPQVAVTATRQANLPAGSPGQRAAARIERNNR